MTEIQEIRQETERERSQLARSVRSGRPGRSKTSACELPSDFLSKQEKEALNGPMTSINLYRFYSWEEFKSWPKNLQTRYLQNLMEKYEVGLPTISVDVFEKSKDALSVHCRRCGILSDLPSFRFNGHGQIYIRNRDRLINDVQAQKEQSYNASKVKAMHDAGYSMEEIANAIPETVPKAVRPIESPATISSMDISVNGFEGLIPMLETLQGMFPINVHIRIQIDGKENGNEGNL